jgi:hypothetical protein
MFIIINYCYNGYVYFKEPFKQFNWKADVKPPSDETQKTQQNVYERKKTFFFVFSFEKYLM